MAATRKNAMVTKAVVGGACTVALIWGGWVSRTLVAHTTRITAHECEEPVPPKWLLDRLNLLEKRMDASFTRLEERIDNLHGGGE